MQRLWTVDADANKEMVMPEKFTPLIIEQDTVRLDGIADHHAWPAILFLQSQSFFEKIKP
jgi:hypothetical protein